MDDESMKKGDGAKNAVPRPAFLVAIVIGALYLAEVIIMNFFHEFAEAAHFTMDALILTAVLLPMLYFLIYRPFSRSVKDLHALSGTLERRVRERTAQLEFSGAEHRAVIASSADAIVRINVDGAILSANPAAHRMFGYGKTEFENKHISLLLPDGYEKVLVEGFAASLDGWDGHSAASAAEVVAVTKSGKKLTVECTSSECLVNSEISFVIVMRDVSERRKAEKELVSIMEAQPDILYVINPKGALIKWNSALQELCGLTRDQMMERPAADFVCEEDRPVVYEGIKEVFEKGSASIEVRFIRRDGALVPHLCNGAMWKNPDGELLGFIGVGKDISERKKAEEALRESEERFRQLSDLSFEGISISVKGKIVDANTTLAQMAGYTLDEIIGKNVFDVTTPESHAVIMEHINKGIESPPYEVTGIRKDGSLFRAEVKGHNILYHGQMARGTAIRDISERIKAEQTIRESEERLRATFDNATSGMAFVNPDGKFARVNAALCRMYGYEEKELIGMSFQEITHPDDLYIGETFLRKVARGEAAKLEVEKRFIRKDGGAIWCSVVASLIKDEHGKSLHLFAHVIDITARKAAEEKLKAAKEAAEEANNLKDKFVSLVSHDLKTPLTSMIGFLHLVRHDYAEPLDNDAKLFLDRAADAGAAMVRLIDDLLTISRFKTGQLKLNRQFFDADYLGAMMAANFSGLARQKGIEIENTIPVNSRIYGDKTLLTEAVQNLVTNAIKFCKSGDHITISRAEGGASTICVRDTGPGIQPNLLNDLFKFEKKTSTRGTAGETGTGFGLPLVKNIMELHGGELGVISEPGKGCLFSLALPYVRPKILLVDDDRHVRLLQTLQLREMKADIIEAENGQDALKAMAGVRPDLVITDIQMPVMDGLELLKRIKGAPETKDIPVIVMSGEFGMEMRDTIFKFGGDDFATKKIDKAEFLPRVRRFIG